jgi:hypothetical protein
MRGFVSGHDFSRAVKRLKENWASAPAEHTLTATLTWRCKSPGAKAQILVGLYGPTEVVP